MAPLFRGSDHALKVGDAALNLNFHLVWVIE
ncbi:uncharacterized protein G2W53_039045 [Senna tora]|uniref:Uncharacterized protein n=1 Tax=Senna tora TaxID=362788 RepID=A0A834W7K4_9FABA|nr:uncharacterized protein G2W53_039045 [Senna tora]